MTNDESVIFIAKLMNLYPNKINKEQKGMWFSRSKGMTPYDATEALETYYVSKKPASDGAVPSINGFLRCFMKHKDQRQAKSNYKIKTMTRYESLKWNLELNNKPISGNATEIDLEILMSHREFLQSVLTYSPSDAGTKSRYETWMSWLKKNNMKTEPYSEEKWWSYQADQIAGANYG